MVRRSNGASRAALWPRCWTNSRGRAGIASCGPISMPPLASAISNSDRGVGLAISSRAIPSDATPGASISASASAAVCERLALSSAASTLAPSVRIYPIARPVSSSTSTRSRERLADAEAITAVIDFGATAVVGDRHLDPVASVVYLTSREITPTASPRDTQVALSWLADAGLFEWLEPATRWLAAYWSFAVDDERLHRWCRTVLLGR